MDLDLLWAEASANWTSRIACHDVIGPNVSRNNSAGCYNSASSDAYTAEHNSTKTNPDIRTNLGRILRCTRIYIGITYPRRINHESANTANTVVTATNDANVVSEHRSLAD